MPEAKARGHAAQKLVRQAVELLKKNKPDDAISILERAMTVAPGTGEIYYYTAQAWIMKKDPQQALEFNRLAEIYADRDTDLMDRILSQKVRIRRMQ
jgi:predicted Zn-dependent protease